MRLDPVNHSEEHLGVSFHEHERQQNDSLRTLDHEGRIKEFRVINVTITESPNRAVYAG